MNKPTTDPATRLPEADASGRYVYPDGSVIRKSRVKTESWVALIDGVPIGYSGGQASYFSSPSDAARLLFERGKGPASLPKEPETPTPCVPPTPNFVVPACPACGGPRIATWIAATIKDGKSVVEWYGAGPDAVTMECWDCNHRWEHPKNGKPAETPTPATSPELCPFGCGAKRCEAPDGVAIAWECQSSRPAIRSTIGLTWQSDKCKLIIAERERDEARKLAENITINRNHYCERINQIAVAIGMTGKDHYSPDAILRNTQTVILERDEARAEIEALHRVLDGRTQSLCQIRNERDEARSIITRIHEALGEHASSDHGSLPEVVGKIVGGLREASERAEKAEAERAAMLAPGGFAYMDAERTRLQNDTDRYRNAAELIAKSNRELESKLSVQADVMAGQAERIDGLLLHIDRLAHADDEELKQEAFNERRFEAACAALTGILANPNGEGLLDAVRFADALLAELAKPKEEANAQINRLRTALEFYADHDNWSQCNTDVYGACGPFSEIEMPEESTDCDGGWNLAEDALRPTKETGP